MALTYENCYSHIRHVLEADGTSNDISMRSIVDEAGEYLYAMHPWKWTEARQAFLTGLGTISGTGKTWTQSTKTITDTGAFTNYTFYEGDRVNVTAGTGLTTGTYRVTAKTDSDEIVIDTDIGANAVDLGYQLERDRVVLPVDFQEVIAIAGENSYLNRINMVSYSELLEYRTDGINVTGAYTFYGAIIHARKDNVNTGSIVRLLEVWPQFSADSTSIFTLYYRRGWARSTNDTFELFIPPWMEGFFVQIVREMALGYEEHDVMTRNERLARNIDSAAEFERLKRMDGAVQDTYGPMNGGAIQSTQSGYPFPFVTTPIPGPT